MPWKTTLPGAALATSLALEALLKANIGDLSAAIANSASFGTPLGLNTDVSMLTTRFGAVTADHVHKGDIESNWKITDGWLRLYVTAGNHRTGVEVSSVRAFIGGSSQFEDNYTTSVFAYIHQDAVRRADRSIQEEEREVAQIIVGDWLRAGVLNFFQNHKLSLLSQERWDDEDLKTDTLSLCQATMVSNFQRDLGSIVVYGIHVLHTGVLR